MDMHTHKEQAGAPEEELVLQRAAAAVHALKQTLGVDDAANVCRELATDHPAHLGRLVHALRLGNARACVEPARSWACAIQSFGGSPRFATLKHLAASGDLDLCAEQLVEMAPQGDAWMVAAMNAFPEAFPMGSSALPPSEEVVASLAERLPWLREVFGHAAARRDFLAEPLHKQISEEWFANLVAVAEAGVTERPTLDRVLINLTREGFAHRGSSPLWHRAMLAATKASRRGQDDIAAELLHRYLVFDSDSVAVLFPAPLPPLSASNAASALPQRPADWFFRGR